MGAGVLVNSLSSCATISVYKTAKKDNKIIIPVSIFAKNKLQIVQVENSLYDIAVRKESDNFFNALLLRCTHADNTLSVFGNGFLCSRHGSIFDNNGAVTKGPAEVALKRYNTVVVKNNEVIIFVD